MGVTANGDEVVDLFVRASSFFGEQVREVGDDQWQLPTPCADWTIHSVVAHVVIGDSQIPTLLSGGAVSFVEEFDPSVLGASPLAAWRGTALAAIRAFAREGALDQRYAHPLGHLSGRRIIGFRISDSLIHGWDIAQALGRDVLLDPEICEYCIDFWQPMAATLASSGYFAPMRMPPQGADVSARLLCLLGRAV